MRKIPKARTAQRVLDFMKVMRSRETVTVTVLAEELNACKATAEDWLAAFETVRLVERCGVDQRKNTPGTKPTLWRWIGG